MSEDMGEINVKCLGCGRILSVPADVVNGQHVRCPYCDVKFAYLIRECSDVPSYDDLFRRESMLIKCQRCGRTIVVDDDIEAGQHVRCPFCEQKFSYLEDGPRVVAEGREECRLTAEAHHEDVRPAGKAQAATRSTGKNVRLDEKKERARIKSGYEEKARQCEWRRSAVTRVIAGFSVLVALMALGVVWKHYHDMIAKRTELRNVLACYINDSSRMLSDRHSQYSTSIKEWRRGMGDSQDKQYRVKVQERESVQDEIKRTMDAFGEIASRLDGMNVKELKMAQSDLEIKVRNLIEWMGKVVPDVPPVVVPAPPVVLRPDGEPDGRVSQIKHSEFVPPPSPEVLQPGKKQSPTIQGEIEKLKKQLKELKYPFDEDSLGKLDLQTQRDVLREMLYDARHEKEKRKMSK